MDLGVYVLQFAKFVFHDSPIEIIASGKLNSEGVDISANITLRFSSGEAVLKISAEEQLDNIATITGDTGMIEVNIISIKSDIYIFQFEVPSHKMLTN